MTSFLPFLFLIFLPFSLSLIVDDFFCTTISNGIYTYLPSATSCSNVVDDSTCESYLTMGSPEPVTFPVPGGTNSRPSYCYTKNGIGGAVTGQEHDVAMNLCPKSCGYCCIVKTNTPDYTSCENKPNPNLNCDSLTPAMCQDSTWHAIILSECPATCGLCGEVKASENTAGKTCTYQPDAHPNCKIWADNGFCKTGNTGNTQAQIKQYCATTCEIC